MAHLHHQQNSVPYGGLRPHNVYFSHDEDDRDELNDELDRIIARQIEESGGEFSNQRATLEATMLLRNQGVNIGLAGAGRGSTGRGGGSVGVGGGVVDASDYLFQFSGSEYDAYTRQQLIESQHQHEHNLAQLLEQREDLLSTGDGDQDYDYDYDTRQHLQHQQQQAFYHRYDPRAAAGLGGRGASTSGRAGGGDTSSMSMMGEIPLEDILAFDGATNQETVCTKLEKIMPYYDESLYYACKEYIFQHGLYHKHHLRTIGLSGVPLRYRLLSLWQRPLATNIGKCYFFFETILVGVSLVQVVLETMPAYSTVVNPRWERTWMITEIPCSVAFLLDIVIHLMVLPSFPNDYSVYSRSSFVKSAEFWVDICSILPTFFMFATYIWPFLAFFDFLKILRVLRFAKVLRQFSSVDQLANTVERSIKPLVAPFVFLFVAVIINSGLIYYIEKGDYDEEKKMFMQDDCDCLSSAPAVLNPQYPCPKVPATILSVPHAMWYSIVTMSTVGYGDYVPRCLGGRIIGTFSILGGSVILAMPIAIVGTYFTDVVGQNARSGAGAGTDREAEKTPFHELLSGEQHNNNNNSNINNNNNNNNNSNANNIAEQRPPQLKDDEGNQFDDSASSKKHHPQHQQQHLRRGRRSVTPSTTPQLRATAASPSSAENGDVNLDDDVSNNTSMVSMMKGFGSSDTAGSGSSFRRFDQQQQQQQQLSAIQEQVQRVIGPTNTAITPGGRLLQFLAECNHASVPLINPSPLIIHQINSFIKKEIEAFLRSLRSRGAYLRLQQAFYNSSTNFTLIPFRDGASFSSSPSTFNNNADNNKNSNSNSTNSNTNNSNEAEVALQARKDELRRNQHERMLKRRNAAMTTGIPRSVEDDERDQRQQQEEVQELHSIQKEEERLRKAKLSEKLDEDDFAHDVRIALSQKGDKAPICLRTMPIVLCGPQLSTHMRQSQTSGGNSSGFGSVGAGSGVGGGGGGGGQNNSNNNSVNLGASAVSAAAVNSGVASMLGSTNPVQRASVSSSAMFSPTGGSSSSSSCAVTTMTTTATTTSAAAASSSKITTFIGEDNKPLRQFPSGATLLPYCAPGCEIPGVPSPFAILWVCPMTNFVSITAIFPVCVTVNGRQAPFESPQRLLFGDQICVHAAGPNSRPLLTYRFTRTEAPFVTNNERSIFSSANNNNNNTAKDTSKDSKNRNSNNNNTAQQQSARGSGSRGQYRTRSGHRIQNTGGGDVGDDDDIHNNTAMFNEQLDANGDRQTTYRVRSLAHDAVREYRAYPLSKYSTTYNSGGGEFNDL